MSVRAGVIRARRGMHAGVIRAERRPRASHAVRATAESVPHVRIAGDVPRRITPARLKTFRKKVWKYWKVNGRHDLPWRQTKDPYRIMVSEVMLQQTQVPRVIEKYKEFVKKFPTVRTLARAPLSDVLKVWSGLGYNRRGKYLHDAAKIILEKYGGNFNDARPLLSLPGVGPYTAAAVRVFAFNEKEVLIETNIRAVYIHHFFQTSKLIDDRSIHLIAAKAAEGQDPREWHWALMDYGVYLKKLHKNPARKSAHYSKQSKFEGSLRQARGAILRNLHAGPHTDRSLISRCHLDKEKVIKALRSLERDGLIKKENGKWRIS